MDSLNNEQISLQDCLHWSFTRLSLDQSPATSLHAANLEQKHAPCTAQRRNTQHRFSQVQRVRLAEAYRVLNSCRHHWRHSWCGLLQWWQDWGSHGPERPWHICGRGRGSCRQQRHWHCWHFSERIHHRLQVHGCYWQRLGLRCHPLLPVLHVQGRTHHLKLLGRRGLFHLPQCKPWLTSCSKLCQII